MGVFQHPGLSPVGPTPTPLLLGLAPSSSKQVPRPGALAPPSSPYRPSAHQGDEIGEGELQADVDHVRTPLSRPQVGVVAVHQVGQQPLLLVPALGSCNRQR